MTVALIDNGSLEPAAQRNLRAVAAALTARVGQKVHAVSWKHSDRIRLAVLDHEPAWTLAPWVRTHVAAGEREFLFVPFFISAQGAIGSALRSDLDRLRTALGFEFRFAEGLAARGTIPRIVAARVRDTMMGRGLHRPSVIVVDHGGPSAESATLRNALAAQIRAELASEIGPLVAASMEGADHIHNRPLLADQLHAPGFDQGDVVIAPLFLGPGRHAGPQGDLTRIARAAAAPGARVHFTELVGTHPAAVDALADAVRAALTSLPAETLA